MTTNDPYETPRAYPAPDQPEQAAGSDEQPYTPPPATEWPAPVQYYSGTAPYEAGAYGQSYHSDTQYQYEQSSGYGQSAYGQSQYGQPSYGQSEYGQTQYGQGYGASAYGQPGYGPSGYGHFGPTATLGHPAYAPPADAAPHRKRVLLVSLAAAVVAAALVIAGVGFATGSGSSTTAGSGSALQLPQAQAPGGGAVPGGTLPGSGGTGSGSTGNGGALPGGGSSSAGSNPVATATQQVGIVTIVSVLKYQSAESAGTGMILSSDGEILTNNHVVNGATSITVTVETTGKSYRADVVGTAPTKDVAVVKLRNASGLQTAKLAASSQSVKVGDAVVGVGNAGGTGTLTAAAGKVTGLDKSITATDESGAEAERLTGLIEVDAPIISGDSGGPLYNAQGQVIGIDTAASTNRQTNAASTAYAIRIDNALSVAKQIQTGVQTTTIHIGLPAFVGFSLQDQNGAVIIPEPQGNGSTIVPNSPADNAGIEPGATITAIGGKSVTSAAQIKTILAARNPGDRVSISWTDAGGGSHTKTVTLTTGPAD